MPNYVVSNLIQEIQVINLSFKFFSVRNKYNLKCKINIVNIYDQVVKFPQQCDRELLECLEKHIKDNDLNFDDTNSAKIEISPSSLTFKNKKLKGLPDKTKQQRINALLMYNQYFLKTIPYVLLDEETLSQMATSRNEMTDKLNELFIVGKALAFSSIKNKYIKNIVNNLPCNYDQPECKIKRRKAQRYKDSGKVDHKGEYTIFGQIWSTIKKSNYNSLKKNDSNTKAWSASLVGEGSYDAGGPYRETITNLCGELMHNVLPLLIQTPNNKNDHGLYRDCWTINPSAQSPTHLEMYEFLGALMGMAFRSGQILDLKLTSFFYKSLAGEPLTIEDLKAIDLYAVQAIKEIENTQKTVTEEIFDSYGAQNMTTRLSNKEEVELVPNGKDITLKYKDIDDFIRLTLEKRFTQRHR